MFRKKMSSFFIVSKKTRIFFRQTAKVFLPKTPRPVTVQDSKRLPPSTPQKNQVVILNKNPALRFIFPTLLTEIQSCRKTGKRYKYDKNVNKIYCCLWK